MSTRGAEEDPMEGGFEHARLLQHVLRAFWGAAHGHGKVSDESSIYFVVVVVVVVNNLMVERTIAWV